MHDQVFAASYVHELNLKMTPIVEGFEVSHRSPHVGLPEIVRWTRNELIVQTRGRSWAPCTAVCSFSALKASGSACSLDAPVL